MKLPYIFLLLFLVLFKTSGQSLPLKYILLVNKADSLFKAQDYISSANMYTEAFKSNNWLGITTDRYNAACSWAMIANADSAFFHLVRIAERANYSDISQITNDENLNALHSDPRWKPLIEKIGNNINEHGLNVNHPLRVSLSSIYTEDQKYRLELNELSKKHGWESKEVKEQWEIISSKDSINLIKVIAILDMYGWLGSEILGKQGNNTLFLVIQHSDQTTQEKYLPMMQQAAKEGDAEKSSLALLEDRVALGQGKRQTYGSQIGRDPETNLNYVLPLEDPDNIDKRRAEVGLNPISDYIKTWNLKWDGEQYKKDLPLLEEKLKKK